MSKKNKNLDLLVLNLKDEIDVHCIEPEIKVNITMPEIEESFKVKSK